MGTTILDAPAPASGSKVVGGSSGWAARSWAAPLAVHLGVYLLLLLALMPLARPGVATPDEGAYALQARLVSEGHWDHTPPLERLDPDGRHYPIIGATQADGRWYPYIKHPLMPVAVGAVMRVAGETAGLVVLPLLGALAAAVAAWLLAAEFDRRWSRTAFWLTALGPVLFNAYVTWAHSLSAAMAGLSLVALVRILRSGPTVARSVGLATALALGALVRSEGVLWAGALLAVLVVVAAARRAGKLLLLAGALGAVLLTTIVGERAWVSQILGGAAPRDLVVRSTEDDPGYLAGRLQGVFHSTFEGPRVATYLLISVAVVAALLVARYARRDDRLAGLVTFGLGLVVFLVWAVEPTGLTKGLFAAAPIALVGLALAVRARLQGVAVLASICGLFALAVYATQYADGGAFQWGGRFLSPTLVPLSVIAAGGFAWALTDRPAERRRELVWGVALVVVASAIAGVGSLGATRAGLQPLYASIAADASPVNVTTSEQLPRMMWREDIPWLVVTEPGLSRMLDRLRREGVDQVTVVADPDVSSAPAARWRSSEDRGEVGTTRLRTFVLRS